MPGPPPNGASSTERCRSRAKSRMSTVSSRHSPSRQRLAGERMRQRPRKHLGEDRAARSPATTPCQRSASASASSRADATRPVGRRDDDAAFGQIDHRHRRARERHDQRRARRALDLDAVAGAEIMDRAHAAQDRAVGRARRRGRADRRGRIRSSLGRRQRGARQIEPHAFERARPRRGRRRRRAAPAPRPSPRPRPRARTALPASSSSGAVTRRASSGSAVKLLTRTSPLTPCGAVTMARQHARLRHLLRPPPRRSAVTHPLALKGEGVMGAILPPRGEGQVRGRRASSSVSVAAASRSGAAAAPPRRQQRRRPRRRPWRALAPSPWAPISSASRGSRASPPARHRPGSARRARSAVAPRESQCLMRSVVHHEPLGMALVDHRIVGPDLLDEAAVARAARIRDRRCCRTGASSRRRGPVGS